MSKFRELIEAALDDEPNLSYSALAVRVECSIGTVERVMRILKKEGLLPKARKQVRGKSRGNAYYKALKELADVTECLAPDSTPYKVIVLLAGDVKLNAIPKRLGVSRQYVNAALRAADEKIILASLDYIQEHE